MRKGMRFLLLLFLLTILPDSPNASANKEEIFSSEIPNGMGICIWGATDEMLGGLSEAGFRWAGDAFFWSACEQEKGKYDFSNYEQILAMYKRHGFRLFIGLSGGNRLYETPDASASPFGESMVDWMVPKSETARQALVRWAVETIRHFKGQGIIWFLFGEPEAIGLSPKEYCWFNEELGKVIKKEMPGEILAGPGTAADMSGLPATVTNPSYLQGCIDAGCVKYWDLLIFQTYLWDTAAPEEAQEPLNQVRKLTGMPISTTLGYPSNVEEGWISSSEEKQAKMLARILLTDQLSGVVITNWYNHQEYDDVAFPQWSFYGLYRRPGPDGSMLDPKPAYFAAKTFSSILSGFRFAKRLETERPEDYVLEFTNGKETRYAAWTRRDTVSMVRMPLKGGIYRIISHLGKKESVIQSDRKVFPLKLGDAPIYLIPE